MAYHKRGGVIEAAAIGREGMVGFSGLTKRNGIKLRAYVRISGEALQIDAKTLQNTIEQESAFFGLLFNYTYTLSAQIAVTVTCNRFHKAEQRLARWLLMARGRTTFVDLALGMESHIKRHVIHRAAALERIRSYLEHGDLAAIEQVTAGGFPILRRIARNTAERKIDHRVVFGFAYHSAPKLMGFLRGNKAHLEQVTGVRYSGELGHPFHVVDDEIVILCLDHPFIPEGRFASLLVHDKELARQLADGFKELWSKAMRDIREIGFHPRGSRQE